MTSIPFSSPLLPKATGAAAHWGRACACTLCYRTAYDHPMSGRERREDNSRETVLLDWMY
ncbi:hypothetical protein M434DRAFT_397390 [Hypoxylon sp. CO27-5]|nr:hypothetical protein M434DRAFT_397390 [Hypoxylon sp. CO27-5]